MCGQKWFVGSFCFIKNIYAENMKKIAGALLAKYYSQSSPFLPKLDQLCYLTGNFETAPRIFFSLLYNNFYLLLKKIIPQNTFAHAFSRLISDGIHRQCEMFVHIKPELSSLGFSLATDKPRCSAGDCWCIAIILSGVQCRCSMHCTLLVL